MGKAKKSNKRTAGGLLGNASAFSLPDHQGLGRGSGAHGNNMKDRFALSELENNLGSLEENQRANACALLSDLYQFNSHNSQSMEALASKKLLSKLAMRLVDHSILVRVAATRALKILTESKDQASLQRVVHVGMFRTALSLAMENGTTVSIEGVTPITVTTTGITPTTATANTSSSGAISSTINLGSTQWLHWKEVQQNLLYSIVNIIVACKETLEEVMTFNRDFLSFLVASFGNFANAMYHSQLAHQQQQQQQVETVNVSSSASYYLPMLNTIANSLIIFCQTKHATVIQDLMTAHCIPTIKQVLQWFHELTTAGEIPSTTNTTVSANNEDHWIIIVQCIEMLLNLLIDDHLSMDMASLIDANSLVHGLMGLLSACQVADMPRPSIPTTTNEGPMIPDTMDDDEEHEIVIPQSLGQSTSSTSSSSVAMYDIELIEVIADLLSSIAGTITQHFSDDMSFLQSIDNSNNNKKGKKKTPSLTLGQQRSLQLIQVFEQCNSVSTTMSLFSHLRARFMMFFIASTEPSHHDMQFILHEGVKVLHVMEKITSLVNDLYALKSVLVSEVSQQQAINAVHWGISLPIVIDHLNALLDYVNNTTASLDVSTKSAVEVWRAKEEEDLLTLKASIITQSSAALDILAQFLSHVALQANPSKQLIALSEEDMKNVAVHILRWISLPQLEIVFSAVNIMTLFVHYDEKQQLVPLQVMMLFTNGLLNRLAAPSAYAMESDKNINKALNVKRSSLMVMDTVINAMIDLHSSDEEQYHSMFIKLKSIDKLKAALHDFHQRYQQIVGNLEADDRDKVEETACNLNNFIEYKESNFR